MRLASDSCSARETGIGGNGARVPLGFYRAHRGLIYGLLALLFVAFGVALFAWYNADEWGAWAIVTAPNYKKQIDPADDPTRMEIAGFPPARHLRFAVEGSHPASLAAWLIDPPPREQADPQVHAALPAGAAWPRGTLLFLHGIFDSKDGYVPTAVSHARRGYRTIVIDARGHGRSTGDYTCFGALEAQDYRQVIDQLERQGLIAGRLGVYGVSYGGGCAAQLAGVEPRVRMVIAINGFASLREIASDRARQFWLLYALRGEAWVGAALRRAEQIVNVDLAQADGAAALRRSDARVLLIHGRDDRMVPPHHAERLSAAARRPARLVLLDGDHRTVPADRSGQLWQEVTAWMDRWLAEEP